MNEQRALVQAVQRGVHQKSMPKRKDREAAEPSCATPYNPLRDRPKMEAAARQLAELIGRRTRRMTAMQFCLEVLRSMGLNDVAVGQSERILISAARKACLGARDSDLILKPEAAAPVRVPDLSSLVDAANVESGGVTCGQYESRAFESRLEERFDANALRSHSLLHLEAFLTPPEVLAILRHLEEGGASNERLTALRHSSGTGRNGAYGDVKLSARSAGAPTPLLALLQALQAVLERQTGTGALSDRVVVTRYAAGGVNWAHQDQSTGGYQAYLLLSRPGEDFGGGELYITDPAARVAGAAAPGGGAPEAAEGEVAMRQVDQVATRQVEWRSSGDLVLFAANCKEAASAPKNWLHGFREVRPARAGAERCQMCVIGLLE